MEPILRGSIRFLEDGRLVWEGRWGMTADAFTEESTKRNDRNETPLLNNFRYTCDQRHTMAVRQITDIPSGLVLAFRGHFDMITANKGKSQFSEKKLELEILPEKDNNDNKRKIAGRGSNRFGNFTLDGVLDLQTNILEVRRIYDKPLTGGLRSARSSVQSIQTASSHDTPDIPKLSLSLEGDETVASPPSVDLSYLAEAREILSQLQERDEDKFFCRPVDAEGLGLRDYHLVVKSPMDLGTIQSKLDNKRYGSLDQCLDDMRLTFVNALMYNPRGSLVYRAATELSSYLEESVTKNLHIPGSTTSIGKRQRIKKKIFEPGEELEVVEGVAPVEASNVRSIKQLKSLPSSTTTYSATISSTTKSGRKVKPSAISIQVQSSSLSKSKPKSKLKRAKPPAKDPEHQDTSLEEEEAVQSFDEIDFERTSDAMFLTPPPSDDEGEEQDIPISAIISSVGGEAHNPTSPSTPIMNTRSSDRLMMMSPTNIVIDDDML